MANELIEFDVKDDILGFRASGWTSNANYHVKKTTILLFINHRAVESSAMKTAIQRTYATFLRKGGHPFVYLTIEIEPHRVDVNVHPTKREVNFLNEDEIISSITNSISIQLSKVDTSRTFMTQTLLPGTKVPTLSSSTSAGGTTRPSQIPFSATKPPRNESSLVRTDPSLRKITSMLPPSNSSVNPASTSSHLDDPTYTLDLDRQPITCRLTTVKDLRADVRAAMHTALTEVFATHTYVGLVDSCRRIAAIQSGIKLYLVDYGKVCTEYFYQIGLTDFANFGAIAFDPPLDVAALIGSAVAIERQAPSSGSDEDETIPWSTIASTVTAQLVQHREMLSEYFHLDLSEDGQLSAMPLLVKGYMPSLAKLPRFLMRLGPCVNWTDEKKCFETFLTELAIFYAPEQVPNTETGVNGRPSGPALGKDGPGPAVDAKAAGDPAQQAADSASELSERREQLSRMLEHVLFPAFRARLVATRDLLDGVVEVADLKGLYRVFERC